MILGEYSEHACTVELQEKHLDILGFGGKLSYNSLRVERKQNIISTPSTPWWQKGWIEEQAISESWGLRAGDEGDWLTATSSQSVQQSWEGRNQLRFSTCCKRLKCRHRGAWKSNKNQFHVVLQLKEGSDAQCNCNQGSLYMGYRGILHREPSAPIP